MTAAVVVDLDTAPPSFYVERPQDVITPPKDGLFSVVAVETISVVTATLRLGNGQLIPVGTERVSERVVGITVPGAELPAGPAVLTIFVWDDVGNLGRTDLDIQVSGTTIKVQAFTDPVFLLETRTASPFDLVVGTEPPFALEVHTASG